MLKTKQRAQSFIPAIIAHLAGHAKFTCKFSDLPGSYRKQPYNLSAKVLARGNFITKVVFNEARNTFTIVKFGISQRIKTKTKPKTKSHARKNSIPR